MAQSECSSQTTVLQVYKRATMPQLKFTVTDGQCGKLQLFIQLSRGFSLHQLLYFSSRLRWFFFSSFFLTFLLYITAGLRTDIKDKNKCISTFIIISAIQQSLHVNRDHGDRRRERCGRGISSLVCYFFFYCLVAGWGRDKTRGGIFYFGGGAAIHAPGGRMGLQHPPLVGQSIAPRTYPI